jgi:tRNA(fMet)-specific endonuclease VapC
MSRYCLDTSAYSNFKRGDSPIVDIVDSAEWLGLPSVVVGELYTGFLLSDRLERHLTELAQFFENPVVHEIVLDRNVAGIYAEIVVSLRRAGTPLPTNDIWVAAAAAHCGATVLTYDDHFNSIQRVGAVVFG